MDENERRLLASFSKSMASMCVRNTMLEDIHAAIETATPYRPHVQSRFPDRS